MDLGRLRADFGIGALFVFASDSAESAIARRFNVARFAAWFPRTARSNPYRTFEAHAPIATTVKRLLVKEGDHVRKGQLLLELDDADIRTQAARAQAQIKSAAADQAALKTGGTQEEVLTLNSQLIKARSARDAAQRSLDSLRRLQQQGAASPGEVRQAEDTLQRAQADVNFLEQKQKDRYSSPEDRADRIAGERGASSL